MKQYTFFAFVLVFLFGATSANASALDALLNRLSIFKDVASKLPPESLSGSALGAIESSTSSQSTQKQIEKIPTPKTLPPHTAPLLLKELKDTVTEKPIIQKRIRFGDKRSDDVRRLQIFLTVRGYLNTTPNGVFGPATREALKKFQKDKGIKGDGTFVGTETNQAISSDVQTAVEMLEQ